MARSGSDFVHLLILHLIETMVDAFLTMFNVFVASCKLQGKAFIHHNVYA